MSILDHILILAVSILGAYPTLRVAGMYAGVENRERDSGHMIRFHLCATAYHLHHMIAALLMFDAMVELIHLTVILLLG